MAEVYDLHRHTDCVVFHFGETTVHRGCFSTTTISIDNKTFWVQSDSYIAYDKQKSNILSWGSEKVANREDSVHIDKFRDRLYRLFKKSREKWDQDDLFLLKAVSDFIRLSVEKLMDKNVKQIKDTGALHYVFVVPTEWEEEIRQLFIRPIFILANLISKDDHKDRLLFCSDVESIFYYFLTDYYYSGNPKATRNGIVGRITPVKKSKALIKIDSIFVGNPLFYFSSSLVFPKITTSNSLSLTTSDIKSGIREFIKTEYFFDAQEETILNIMEELGSNFYKNMAERDEASYLMIPFITDESISEFDKNQKTLIQLIRPFDICAEISKKKTNSLKDLLQNNLLKSYSILKYTDKFSSKIELDRGLENWARFLFEYNRISFGSSYIVTKSSQYRGVQYNYMLDGAALYLLNAVQNSDIYSKPRILASDNSVTSSSKFLKPNAVMKIDISFKSTALSLSLLNQNGLVKKIWNNDYFVPDIRLRPLSSFFSFSEVSTLNVKNSFIAFVEEHFTDDSIFLAGDKNYILTKDMIVEIEDILTFGIRNKGLQVSTQQQIYIKAFVSIYMIYINHIVSRKLSTITELNSDIKIGYAVTIDNMLLKRLFGIEDNLKDIIYASNLVQKDDGSKKLRIATQGEGLFLVIQQFFKLKFRLKSFFVVAQLHEDYVQLTLNQVVTRRNEEKEHQEAIIIQDEIIPVPNIYKSLCLKMWNKIVEDNNLIHLCKRHRKYNELELLDIFTAKNKIEFTSNLKEYISNNILHNNFVPQITERTKIHLSRSCNCQVSLAANDIIDISFRPVLQAIISIISTSLINTQLFGKYRNIRYVFHLIRFNYNPQFQRDLIKILDNETAEFLYEHKIGLRHYTIPKLLNQLLQPILQQELFSYKAFQEGVLHHVYGENYGFGFDTTFNKIRYNFKNNLSDSKSTRIDSKTVFPLFKKGDKISSGQANRIFYLNSEDEGCGDYHNINFFKLKKTDTLMFDEPLHIDDTSERIDGPFITGIDSKPAHDVPFIISIVHKGYSSSLSLAIKRSGIEVRKRHLTTIAEPMTLARY